MNRKYTFYIGVEFDKDGVRLGDYKLSMYRLDDFIGLEFGGFTRTDATGGWKNGEDASVILEHSLVYTVISDREPEDLKSIAALARVLFRQTAVMMTVENLVDVHMSTWAED